MQTPLMINLYGLPKRGKTSVALACFPNGLVIGVPSAIAQVAQNELGFTPRIWPQAPMDLPQLVGIMHSVAAQADQFDAIVVDDASLLCKNSMVLWDEEAEEIRVKNKKKNKDNFYKYHKLEAHLVKISNLARHMGIHVVLIWHEKAPGISQGVAFPGGPEVPAKKERTAVAAWGDINVRVTLDASYPDPWLQRTFYCDPKDPKWITGDRTGVCTRMTPGSLRSVIEAGAAGYQLSRLSGLEWQTELAHLTADMIVQGIDPKKAVQDLSSDKKWVNHNPYHLRWAMQDGIAEGVLRIQRNRSLFNFDNAEASAGPSAPPPPAN